jgi:hypothetical protein
VTSPLLDCTHPGTLLKALLRARTVPAIDVQILAALANGPSTARALRELVPGGVYVYPRLKRLEAAGRVREAGTVRTGRGPRSVLWALADRTPEARGP